MATTPANGMEGYGLSRYDAANKRPRGQEGVFQKRDGNQSRDESRRAAMETTAPTFSELQGQGRARPAPMPLAPAMPMGGQLVYGSEIPGAGDTGTETVTPQGPRTPTYSQPGTTQIAPRLPVPETLGNPSQPQGGGNDAGWSTILANLEAQFAGQRSRLNEDLARRGVYSGSGELGAGGRLGDLEGQQSRAIASAQLDYQQRKDDEYNRLMQQLLPILLGG